MATDLEKLVVSLEARIDKFEKGMQKAGLLTDQTMGRIERRIQRTESAFERMGLRLASGLLGLGALRKIFGQLDEGASHNAAVMREWENALTMAFNEAVSGLRDAAGAMVSILRPLYDWLIKVDQAFLAVLGFKGGRSRLAEMFPLPSDQSVIERKRDVGVLPDETIESGLRLKINRPPKGPKAPKQQAPDILADSQAMNEELERLNKNWEDMKDISGDVFRTLVDDVKAGKSAIDILTDSLTKLEDRLLSLAEQKLLDILFGSALLSTGATPGGGILGGTGLGSFFRGLQGGGPAMAGRPYIVGERGPELFVPQTAGTVVPGSHVGNSVSFSTSIDARGSSLSRGELNAILNRRDRQLAQSVRTSLPAMLTDAQERGV